MPLLSSAHYCSIQFSCSVISDSLRPNVLQHARYPCLSQFPELTQPHVHQVSDAFQSSHPLSSPSPPAFNLSQHQGLFFTNILSDSVGSLFVDGCFLFDKVSFVYFTFNFLAKEDMSKKALLRPMLNPLLLMFF